MTDSAPNTPPISPIPGYLAKRYRGWRATDHAENKVWYQRLADEGQRPRCMIISCCDSRVNVSDLFGAGPGELFIHRNVANLVPSYQPDSDHHGTSAALEYAVTSLNIVNLIVIGHSLCGGVQGCHAMCSGEAPQLEETQSFVGRWLDILRPGYERVKDIDGKDNQIAALEKEAVRVSLENLMTFPFVRDALATGKLSLHGMWMDIRYGELEAINPETGAFEPV